MNYLVLLRYVGTDFCGFQAQPGRRTVQGELTRAATEVFGAPCSITGCSRTDSGVHADMFCALLSPTAGGASIPPDRLPRAMAPALPDDLSLYAAKEAPAGFHPRYSVTSKEYRYEILNASVKNPFEHHRAWHYPYPIDDAAFSRMQEASGHFVGRRDFASLMAEGSPVSHTIRTIYSCTCHRVEDHITVRVRGDGFLYHMVRILVGTLVEVAAGRIAPDDIPSILDARDRTRAGMTAPPDGLYLARVEYGEGILSFPACP